MKTTVDVVAIKRGPDTRREDVGKSRIPILKRSEKTFYPRKSISNDEFDKIEN